MHFVLILEILQTFSSCPGSQLPAPNSALLMHLRSGSKAVSPADSAPFQFPGISGLEEKMYYVVQYFSVCK